MSTLAVNTITDANGGNTATINSMTPTADSLQGFRNRIINGDMRIDQRNAGAAVSVLNPAQTYTLDRYVAYNNATNTYTVQQSSTAPSGFSNSLVITNGTASSATSSMYQLLGQRIEAYNFNDFVWGTASAKALTVSFWVYTSQTGTYSFVLRNGANNRFYPQSFSVASANTWTQITQTVTGDTSGTWSGTNGTGLEILFCLSCGSNFLGTSGAWTGTQALGVTGQTQFNATGSATFYITGVQLEVGSVATPFERIDYGRQLIQCQRYYNVVRAVLRGADYTSVYPTVNWTQQMRASPTCTLSSGTASLDITNIGAYQNGAHSGGSPIALLINASAEL